MFQVNTIELIYLMLNYLAFLEEYICAYLTLYKKYKSDVDLKSIKNYSDSCNDYKNSALHLNNQ